LAQRRYDIKGEISNLKREDELLKAERDSIDQEFERRLKSRGSTATKAGGFTITLKEDDKYPMIGDHTVFETYVLDTKKLHLLQKRLSMTSIQEELAAMRAEQTALRTQLVEAQTKEDINSIFAKVKEFISHNAITNISLRNPNSFSRTEDLKVYLDELLDTVYQIPGISLVTHITLNQTKRGS
jgi:hypothetical protein